MERAVKAIGSIDNETALAHIRDRYGLDVEELRPRTSETWRACAT
jgi:hypothetical protein